MVIVVMGPSGSGKSTVGAGLAEALGATFVDADDLQPPENLRKMASGTPLEERDREGWLAALGAAIDGWLAGDVDVVLACSALREAHRARLRKDPRRVVLVHLRVPEAELARRLAARTGHFFGPELLASQLDAFEDPTDAVAVDATAPPPVVVAAIVDALRPRR